jgi:hypothetical protein
MANVSLSLTAAQVEDNNPENIAVGSAAPGTGDIELRVNTSNITSLKQLFLALEKFDYFVNDQNYGPVNFKEL